MWTSCSEDVAPGDKDLYGTNRAWHREWFAISRISLLARPPCNHAVAFAISSVPTRAPVVLTLK